MSKIVKEFLSFRGDDLITIISNYTHKSITTIGELIDEAIELESSIEIKSTEGTSIISFENIDDEIVLSIVNRYGNSSTLIEDLIENGFEIKTIDYNSMVA